MIGSLYLHEKRTLGALWEHSDGGFVLTEYREFPAIMAKNHAIDLGPDIREFFSRCAETTIVLHSKRTCYHRFPVSDSERLNQRIQFELSILHPLSPASGKVLDEVPQNAIVFGNRYHAFNYTTSAVSLTAPLSHAYRFTSDILCDVESVRKGLLGNVILIGVRGENLWTVCISNERLEFLDVSVPSTPNAQAMVEQVKSSQTIMGWKTARVILFGDAVNKPVIEAVSDLLGPTVKVSRLNPFTRVRSQLNESTAKAVLSKAHVLAPLYGALLVPSYSGVL